MPRRSCPECLDIFELRRVECKERTRLLMTGLTLFGVVIWTLAATALALGGDAAAAAGLLVLTLKL